ncbi:CoA transferase [soil metagenome]
MNTRVFSPSARRASGAPAALEGLRVLDFSRMLAGPFSTQQLADLGAEIVKVETPVVGDDSRHYMTTGAGGEGAFYLSTNRNKKSIALDLKSVEGCRVARELAKHCDIVVENFSNGVMDKFGLGYEALAALNPRLVYCSISGYGRDDDSPVPRRGYDGMFQAASGFMSMTGDAAGPAMRTTVPVIDLATALNATSAILAAVIARERLGVGQLVEIALIDVAMSLTSMYGTAALISGEPFGRNANRSPQTAPSDVYDTADYPMFITCGNDRLFQRMMGDALQRPDLAKDPAFATNLSRVANEARLTRTLKEILASRPQAYWLERLEAAGVPAAPVNDLNQAFDSPDVKRRELIGSVPHPTAGEIPMIRSPFRMSVTPAVDPKAPPLLGEQRDELLRDVLQWSEADIDRSASAGAFGDPRAGARAGGRV